MKYYAQLALAAMLLFSLSAALSLWLNQSRQTTEAKESQDKSVKKVVEPQADAPKDAKSKDKGDSRESSGDVALMNRLRDSEERLARRKSQAEMILRDLSGAREAVESLQRQVTTEAQDATARAAENEQKSVVTPKTPAEPDPAAEKKGIDQLARVYDAMAPESAAPILKQMADSGKLDTVVKILAAMKERQAAQVLAALADTSLAGQLTDRLRVLKRALPPGTALPPGATITPAIPPLAPVKTP